MPGIIPTAARAGAITALSITDPDKLTEMRMYFTTCGNAAWALSGGKRPYADELLGYCMHKKGYFEGPAAR